MEIIDVSISKVKRWEKNPRNIKKESFERLKKQIKELGLYKPLLAFKQKDEYIVLGGNMRLPALRELGYKKISLSIVKPKNNAEKIKYALSDNDRAGEYVEQNLAELIQPHVKEINLKDYKVDLAEPVDIGNVLTFFGPDFDFDGEDDPLEDIEGAAKDYGDYIMFTFESQERADMARELLGLGNVKKSLEGRVLIDLLRKSQME